MVKQRQLPSTQHWTVIAALFVIGNCASISHSSERWARGEDLSDGWVGSMSPFPSGEDVPVQRVHHNTVTSTVTPSVRSIEELAPATTPGTVEGLFEVVVGKKSPMTESVGSSGASGSPDVIIGRVMPTLKSINFPTTSTTAVTGQTAQTQSTVKPSDAAQEDDDDDDDAEEKTEDSEEVKATTVEADERSDADSSEDSSTEEAAQRNDVALPLGSFYLPAVSNEPDEYYSEREQAIYIPLHRPEVEPPPYASSPSVVFVRDPKSRREEVIHRSKDEENEDDEDENEEQTNSSEEADTEDSAPRPLSAPPAVPVARVPPPKAQAGPLDLVMTLYPNLPKLLPQTHLAAAHTLQSVLERNKAPVVNSVSSAGSTLRVIHDAKKLAPPQGYLPQLLPKPVSSPAVKVPVTQLKLPTKKPAFNLPVRPHQAATNAQVPSSVGTAIKYTPFTTDDISPLNFLLPSSSGSTEKAAIEQKPVTIPPSKITTSQSRDHVFQASAPIAHDPLKIVPAPTIDLTRNTVAHETSFRPALGSSHAHGVVQGKNQQLGKQNFNLPPQPIQQSKIEEKRQQSSTHQVIHVPGDTGEIVVRTRMATSNNNDNNFIRIPGSAESAEVIVGYIEDLPNDKISSVKYDVQPFFPGQQKSFSKAHLPQKHSFVSSESHKFQQAAKANQRVPNNAASIGHSGESLKPEPEMQGDFRPLLNPEHHVKSQDLSHQQSQAIADLPLSLGSAESLLPTKTSTPAPVRASHDDEEDVYAAPRLPEILDDQHVAGSQIHEATVYDVNLPRVQPAKPLGTDDEGKSSSHYYKPGKVSPKGAMYTVTQGHSKVKFFGFNALHKGDLKRVDADDKYLLFNDDLDEAEWKSGPYLPVRVAGGNNPALPPVEKKKVDIVPHKKSSIRPVFFAKRPAEITPDNSGWSPSIFLSNPYEYHAQLQKIVEENGRLSSKA